MLDRLLIVVLHDHGDEQLVPHKRLQQYASGCYRRSCTVSRALYKQRTVPDRGSVNRVEVNQTVRNLYSFAGNVILHTLYLVWFTVALCLTLP